MKMDLRNVCGHNFDDSKLDNHLCLYQDKVRMKEKKNIFMTKRRYEVHRVN